MKAIIIDDEYLAREMIQNLISRYHPDISVMASCPDGLSGRSAILEHRPDLVFLDVQMPGMTGFEMLDSLQDIADFQVIFTTAHDDYAIKAIRYAAFDYLLKPIDTQEFIDSIGRLSNSKVSSEQLNFLKGSYQERSEFKQIVISHARGLSFLTISDIIMMKSENNYTRIHSVDRRPVLASKTLGFYDKLLRDHDSFMRVHKQYLINTKCIKEYLGGDENLIRLKGDLSAKLARSQKKKFLALFKN